MKEAKNLYISCTVMSTTYVDWKYYKSCKQMVSSGKKGKIILDEEFIQNYDKESDKGQMLEVHVTYPKDSRNKLSDLSFLPERMKTDKYEKVVCNL